MLTAAKIFCNFLVAFLVNDVALAPQPTHPTLEDVRAFLQQLHDKMAFYEPNSLTYEREPGQDQERTKNQNALRSLGLRSSRERADWIKRLRPDDYTAGPHPDMRNYPPPGNGPLWQFGLFINEHEVYIKLQLGAPNTSPVCLSFHPVERGALRYPLR